MRNISRMIVGIVAIPIVVAIIFFLPVDFFIALVMVVAGVGLYEYFSLAPRGLHTGFRVLFAAMGAILPILGYYGSLTWMVGGVLFVLAILMVFAMRTLSRYEGAFAWIGTIILGFSFVALPLSISIPIITASPYGRGWVLWLVLVVWGGDTGAFYLGTLFGKHKLYPRVSPKKSVEGVIGGMLSAVFVGVIVSLFIRTDFRILEIVILPLVLLLLGQLGDFSESMLKRGAGVKDSGWLLGGHGGILDRIDSFLFAIPFFYFYLLLRS